MNYLTTVELSEIWKISSRRISLLCSENRIEGVVKKGKTWLIPMEAKKPEDPRKLRKVEEGTLDYYNDNAEAFIGGTIDVKFVEIQDAFLSYLPKKAKIMDFGCGSGRDTKYFLEKGHDVDAIDGSKELCKLASEYTGIAVKQMKFEEMDVKEEFDGLWACASILHVQKGSLPEIIKRITDATKKNGIIYVSFKYGDFEGVKNGRYFTYLTEESFIEILEKGQTEDTKLMVEKSWVSGDVRVDRGEEQWLNVILRKVNLQME